MHWLAEKLQQLGGLAARHVESKTEQGPKLEASLAEEARSDFLTAIRETVAEIGQRRGVVACFVAHEGLVFEATGSPADVEALAAVAQAHLAVAGKGALTAELGEVRQMVLIGSAQKLALFRVGDMALGILARSETTLGEALRN